MSEQNEPGTAKIYWYLASTFSGHRVNDLGKFVCVTADFQLIGTHVGSISNRDTIISAYRDSYAALYSEGYELEWVNDPATHPVLGKYVKRTGKANELRP